MPVVEPAVEAYTEAHTTPPPALLQELAGETTRTLDAPQMMVGPVEGRFLEFLVWATGARRVLEIGTFSGYSALSMAAGLGEGGTVVTCEIDPKAADVARRYVAASPWASVIDIRLGPALETLGTLDGPFDLVFVDADKAGYEAYLEAVLPKLSERGLVVVDNTLWSGRVLDPGDTDEDTEAIRSFNDRTRADPRLVCVQLPVRDGVTLVRRA